jgi:hypothetical protein
LSSEAEIAAFASPINLPALAFSSGASEPRPRLASEIGALSPRWARRALFKESRSPAAAKALAASLTHFSISAGLRAKS